MVKLITSISCACAISLASETSFLLDMSGSMSSNPQSVEAIKLLTKKHLNDKNIELIGFNDTAFHIKSLKDVRIGGNTAIAKALKIVNKKSTKYIILVTDGIPNSPQEALAEAKKLKKKKVKICSIFLKNKTGQKEPEILKEISEQVFTSKSIMSAYAQCVAVKEQWVAEAAKRVKNDIDAFVSSYAK